MKKIIVVVLALLCISIVAFNALVDSDQPTTQQVHHKVSQKKQNAYVDKGYIESQQALQVDAKKSKEKSKPVEFVSAPPTLKELRKKISSAFTPKEFIQVVKDIEYGAAHEDVTLLIRELYDVWVTIDPLAALNYSNNLATRYEDANFRTYALEVTATHSIDDAQQWLYQNNTGSQKEQDANVLAVYSGLAINEPVEALQKIDEIQDVYTKHLLELRALEEWAKTQPEQALEWVENNSIYTSSIGIDDAYLAIVSPMIEHSPSQAEPVILSMRSGEQKNSLVTQYTQKLASEDSDAAIRWAQNITDNDAYSTAISTALEVIASSDHNQIRAVEYAKEESNPELREHFVIQAIGYVAHKQPRIAARELSSMTFKDQKDAALSIAYTFSEDDSDGMRAWLDALPSEELREFVARETSN